MLWPPQNRSLIPARLAGCFLTQLHSRNHLSSCARLESWSVRRLPGMHFQRSSHPNRSPSHCIQKSLYTKPQKYDFKARLSSAKPAYAARFRAVFILAGHAFPVAFIRKVSPGFRQSRGSPLRPVYSSDFKLTRDENGRSRRGCNDTCQTTRNRFQASYIRVSFNPRRQVISPCEAN